MRLETNLLEILLRVCHPHSFKDLYKGGIYLLEMLCLSLGCNIICKAEQIQDGYDKWNCSSTILLKTVNKEGRTVRVYFQ